jgi:glycosyltransferase involved in cell wall biosynthesis
LSRKGPAVRPRSPARSVSIIIPTLNEEKNLPKVLSDVQNFSRKSKRKIELIIVDGHSSDRTVALARRAGARILYDSIGKGSAIIAGIFAARAPVLVIMDADCSHTADELPELISRVEKSADICMGSRFMPGGGSDDITRLRYLGNKFFVCLVNILWGTKYTDLCYGYRSMRTRAAREMRLTSKGFGIETEISIKSAKAGLRTVEIPSWEKLRLHGESRLKTFRDGFIILKTIAREFFAR